MDYFYLFCRPFWRKRRLSQYQRIVKRATALEASLEPLSDKELGERLDDLQTRAQASPQLRPLLPVALALGREFSRRRLGMRHYDVQLVGTLALYEGHIAEMDTGEGKTLMAPLAAWLHLLEQPDQCCHIVTANEYLAARDAQWMGPLYEALGLSVGLVVPGQAGHERVYAYQKQVVYATAKEVVFDSLREPMRERQAHPADAILRPGAQAKIDPKYDFAIVDEVDSVLIDQASSPLQIGSQTSVSPQLALYQQAHAVAGQLVRGVHYRLLHDDRKVELKDEGKAESRRGAGQALRLLPPGHKWQRYVTCALAARHIYKRDQHYVVRQGRIVLLDESTGRMMPGRQLPDGIHQALEIQNGITPSAELRGNLTTTFQTFFRKYKKLAGMTGTASMAARELLSVYGLAVVPLPPNKVSHRRLLNDQIFRSTKRKYHAALAQIQQIHASGRPLLIAVGSVLASEELSKLLDQLHLPHEVLNAKNHAREAEIIAQAGREGRITIITNMAGRGVDITLGPGVSEKGGIFLLGLDRLHYRRLDDQLAGRIGRQGDPGDCQFFLSLRDDLLRQANRKKITRLRLRTRSRRNEPIAQAGAAELFRDVQKHIAGVSSRHRQAICRNEKQREKLKAQGMWEDWMDAK